MKNLWQTQNYGKFSINLAIQSLRPTILYKWEHVQFIATPPEIKEQNRTLDNQPSNHHSFLFFTGYFAGLLSFVSRSRKEAKETTFSTGFFHIPPKATYPIPYWLFRPALLYNQPKRQPIAARFPNRHSTWCFRRNYGTSIKTTLPGSGKVAGRRELCSRKLKQ